MTAKELREIANRDLNAEEALQYQGLMEKCLKCAEGGHYQMGITPGKYLPRVRRELKFKGFEIKHGGFYAGFEVWVLSWE